MAAFAVLALAACASNHTVVPAPQAAGLAVTTLLIDVNARSGWVGTTRYIVSYTQNDQEGLLELSGRRHGSRKISWDEVAHFGNLVLESGILLMPYRQPTCLDCTVWEVQVRLNDRVSGLVAFSEEGVDPLPPLIEEIQKVSR